MPGLRRNQKSRPVLAGAILLRWLNFGATRYTGQDGGAILEAVAPQRFVFQWTPGNSTTTVEFDWHLEELARC
jgi:hypothetical protein